MNLFYNELLLLVTAMVNGVILWFIVKYLLKNHSRAMKGKRLELFSLKTVSQIINEGAYLDVKIDLILDIIKRFMDTPKVVLLLQNNLKSTLHRSSPHHTSITMIDPENETLKRYFSKRQPGFFQQMPSELAALFPGLSGGMGILCPVISGDLTIGLLCLYYEDNPFKKIFRSRAVLEESMQTLSTIVNQLGTAIEREALSFERASINENITGILSHVLDSKNSYTHGHCLRVAKLAVALGKWLDLGAEELRILKYGGLLHDLGKVNISDEILTKPGALNQQEYEEIKLHPEKGAEIIKKLDFFKDVSLCIQFHHERYDGKGYPSGLIGEEIPLLVRIITIADAFDAMTSARSYGKVLTTEEAQAEIVKYAGTQFDPVLVLAFVKLMKEQDKKVKEINIEKEEYCA